ncbi:hypothetical protein C2E23DRAFT_742387 [Lenzites betulinus]|nr:hypothetical protein C2E23DRAFT_742387 [Lenzites betulinus]
MSSDSDAMSHFTPLDELVQVIYQGSSRFVIISSVDDASWTVHVGLTGEDGRWWQGRWTEKDVRKFVGAKVSGFLLDSFVEKMADTFVKGELSIGGWSSGNAAPIQLVFGTQAKTPIQVELSELSLREAAAHAIKVFAEIALQAQSRKCRLYPSSLDISSAAHAFPGQLPQFEHTSRPRSPPAADVRPNTPHKGKSKEKVSGVVQSSGNPYKRKAEEAEEEIQVLKAALEKSKREQNAIMTDPSRLYSVNKPTAQPTATKPKGASMANPTKKARKYKPLEFESDDE